MPDIPRLGTELQQALGRVGQVAQNIVLDLRQEKYNAEAQYQYTQGIYQMDTEIGEFMGELESDPDYNNFGSKWDQKQGQLYDDITKNITIPESRERFDASWFKTEASMRIDVERASRRIQVEQQLSDYQVQFDGYVKNGDVPGALTIVQAMLESGYIYPAEATKLREQAKSVGNYNLYFSRAAAMPDNEGWEWILGSDIAPELTEEQKSSISGILYNRMVRTGAQAEREFAERNDRDLRKVMVDVQVNGESIPAEDLYDKSKYALTVSQANSVYEYQLDRDNSLLEAKLNEDIARLEARREFAEQTKAIEQELLEKQLTVKTLFNQLTDADVIEITKLASARGEYWRKQKVQQDERLKQMTEARRKAEKDPIKWWTLTGAEYENRHYEMLEDDNITKEEHARWVRNNFNDPNTPWDTENNPHIYSERGIEMLNEIDKAYAKDEWGRSEGINNINEFFKFAIEAEKDDPENVAALITGRAKLTAEFNIAADELETETEKIDLASELIGKIAAIKARKLLDYFDERVFITEPAPEVERAAVPEVRDVLESLRRTLNAEPTDTFTYDDGRKAYYFPGAFNRPGAWYLWDGTKFIVKSDKDEIWKEM